ncbi:MAG: FTR1 family iron permease [Clostridia bacterium]|nr:FTR1 family iron permease [Clostridia bacterium]
MKIKRFAIVLTAVLTVLMAAMPIEAPAAGRYNFVDDERYDMAGNRWGSAADRIDEFLDQAFEYYLAGDTANGYDCVNNAYFCVYETTGFERQTMTYVSGPRKNAVELQFTTCKRAVKNTDLSEETQIAVRSELNKLKSMIREDANKLAARMEPPQPQTTVSFWKDGVRAASDPWAALAGNGSGAQYRSWTEAAEMIFALIDTAEEAYGGRDYETALDNINTAYFAVYEESGFSRKIYTALGSDERLTAEGAFASLRAVPEEALESGKYKSNPWKTARNFLKKVIRTAAVRIDEAETPAVSGSTEEVTPAGPTPGAADAARWANFWGAFGIIVREGLEAILVIGAIIAYLVKSGRRGSLKHVYAGALAGIAASFAAAAALYFIKKAAVAGGMAQELIEGITALIAVCVLFYVSNWMISKSEAAAWTGYIDRKVQAGVEKRSAFTLAFTAFLAVFREGAEVVLFYQPMLFGDDASHVSMVIWGFLTGCVLLVFVYLAITKLSVRLPIKVFFTATSILMAVMCVAFLGSGIKELSEGGAFEVVRRVEGIPENDVVQVLGIYPYLETLLPQLILAVILIVTFLCAHYRGKLTAQRRMYEEKLAEAERVHTAGANGGNAPKAVPAE